MSYEEKSVSWENGPWSAEGLLHRGALNQAVVICHPHPLMGGSMHNNVVETLVSAFADAGYSTLRFNFRGVGRSTGSYGEGRAEQDDIRSAINYLADLGFQSPVLAGYSFGAWVITGLLKHPPDDLSSIYLVSPPNLYFDFDWNDLKKTIDWIACGNGDTFCDAAALKRLCDVKGIALDIIDGADHFYGGCEAKLALALAHKINLKR